MMLSLGKVGAVILQMVIGGYVYSRVILRRTASRGEDSHRQTRAQLYLLDDHNPLRSYRVALGLSPTGPKEQQWDFRT